MFPFSFGGSAKAWLSSLEAHSITTWDVLAQKFMNKYFLPSKLTKFGNEIMSFCQNEFESLYDAWECYKEMLCKCPKHCLHTWMTIHTFYDGLLIHTKYLIDVAVDDSILSKNYREAYDLIEKMFSNHYHVLD